MNTIHSSSLASYQTGYIRPARDSLDRTKNPNDAGINSGKAENVIVADKQASTPETIKTALTQAGIDKPLSFFENTSPRNYKALQAYARTNEQLNQSQLDNLITHVDYYA